MTDDHQKRIADRAELFAPKRGGEVRRIAGVAVAALLIGGGYLGWQNYGERAPQTLRIAIPAAEEGPTTKAPPERSLFTGLPPAPERQGIDLMDERIAALTEMIVSLEAKIAEDTPSPVIALQLAALEEGNRLLAEELRGVLVEDRTLRDAERDRRDALELELEALRRDMAARPDPTREEAAAHARELERMRLQAQLDAAERADMRVHEARIAEHEHTRRKELKALETREALSREQQKFEQAHALKTLEAQSRERELAQKREDARRAREIEARDAAARQAKDAAEAAIYAEGERRRSGGIAMEWQADGNVVGTTPTLVTANGITSTATLHGSSSGIVPAGTLIAGVLETAIQSDLPGMIRAVVSEPVWSADAARVLIPKGSRLIGRYEADISTGQTRILVAWERVTLPDQRSVELAANGADALGRAGLSGHVDAHFASTFEAALLISVVSAIGDLGSAARMPNAIMQDATDNGASTVSNALGEALSGYLAIPPTIHVDQGTPVRVFVQRDIAL